MLITVLLQMVQRCVVGGCNNVKTSAIALHKWPGNDYYAGKWNKFVDKSRSDWKGLHKIPTICSDHFQVSPFKVTFPFFSKLKAYRLAGFSHLVAPWLVDK
jgi:hypothetical protein